MGALRQPLHSEPPKKQPGRETTLDQYGRDPKSPSELLRKESSYEHDAGYAPLYTAWMADLPRLVSGSVCWAMLMSIASLSLGRKPDRKGTRHAATLPVTTEYLAQICRCNVRAVQVQLDELKDRGIIAVKTAGRGQYILSLLYRDWQGIDDYAVWKRSQVVAIDDGTDPDNDDDEEAAPISKDAVKLCKTPPRVGPGRATRPFPVKVGVTSVSFQNDSVVDTAFDAVVQSGRLVVYAKVAGTAKGEVKANAQRRGRREIPPNEGIDPANEGNQDRKLIPHGPEICGVFDPLLQASGARLLSLDRRSLYQCSVALGDMPIQNLESDLSSTGRGERAVSSPKVVVSIIREARENWEAMPKGDAERDTLLARLGLPAWNASLRVRTPHQVAALLRNELRIFLGVEYTQEQQADARRLLEILQ